MTSRNQCLQNRYETPVRATPHLPQSALLSSKYAWINFIINISSKSLPCSITAWGHRLREVQPQTFLCVIYVHIYHNCLMTFRIHAVRCADCYRARSFILKISKPITVLQFSNKNQLLIWAHKLIACLYDNLCNPPLIMGKTEYKPRCTNQDLNHEPFHLRTQGLLVRGEDLKTAIWKN